MTPALSYWEKTTYYAPSDVIIIGAGLMGLWTAWELKQRSPLLRITIVERNTTPLGASTRNAGFACFGSLTELIHDEALMGVDSLLNIVEMRYKGIEKIKHSFTADEINYVACGGYEALLKDYEFYSTIPDKIDYFNRLLQPIVKQKAFENATNDLAKLGLKNFDALIWNTAEGAIHSGKLVQALSKKLIGLGVQILCGVAVQEYVTNNHQVTIQLSNGATVQSSRLIICANAFINKITKHNLIQPGRGQIIITKPIPALKTIGTFHFDEGFYYWRNIDNRILLGGGRNTDFSGEATTEFGVTAIIQTALFDFLKKHFCTPFEIDYSWSGIMGFSADKKPLIQSVQPNVLAVSACNGMGVALSPVLAETVANTYF